jgi:hypothetical protein
MQYAQIWNMPKSSAFQVYLRSATVRLYHAEGRNVAVRVSVMLQCSAVQCYAEMQLAAVQFYASIQLASAVQGDV